MWTRWTGLFQRVGEEVPPPRSVRLYLDGLRSFTTGYRLLWLAGCAERSNGVKAFINAPRAEPYEEAVAENTNHNFCWKK